MSSHKGFFDVDQSGLAALLRRRGDDWGAALLLELVQNALDQNVRHVDVTVQTIPGVPEVEITVTDDDPDGFEDLRLAYTLFAPTTKARNATKRGRFTLGEKLVIAACKSARITTTRGCVTFAKGMRVVTSERRATGTEFVANLRMSRDETSAMLNTFRRVATPDGVTLTLNGEVMAPRPALATFEVELTTETANEEGTLCKVRRKTEVRVYEPFADEAPSLYEMGLPVMPLDGDDRWCLDVGQRVPLTVERNNVTPAYLRALRVATANAMADWLRPEDATTPWVRDALADSRTLPTVVKKAVELRFGSKAVTFDPSDPEANSRATAEGFALIRGGHLSADEWRNVRRVEGLLPAAGQLFPTPKVYNPDGEPEELVPESHWTPGMRAVAKYANRLHLLLIGDGKPCHVRFARSPMAFWGANYGFGEGVGRLCFNVAKLPRSFFSDVIDRGDITDEVDAILLHEFGHYYASDHLSADYHKALCRLGAQLKHAADISKPIVAEFAGPRGIIRDELQYNGQTISTDLSDRA